MLRGRNGISAGRVQDDDATARGRLNIDVVHADSSATDHAQSRTSIQDLRRHFCLAAHHQRAELRNKIDEFLFARTGLDRNFERLVARKFVDAALGNGIGDQYFRWRHTTTANVQRSTRFRKVTARQSLNVQRSMSIVATALRAVPGIVSTNDAPRARGYTA